MRLPFPERVSLYGVAIFAVALFIVQRLEGTATYFATGCFLFILVSAFAFNAAGGLTRTSGVYIFFYSMLVVIVGITYKAFLGEPADSNLADPRTTIEVYIGGISAMFAAGFVSRRLSRKTGLLERALPDSRMYRAFVGCTLVGSFATLAISLLGASGRALETAFDQLNYLGQLGIIIGVMGEIRNSRGRSSASLLIVASIAWSFLWGVLGFSKQGMLGPLVCWIVPVWALGYRLSRAQVLGWLLAGFIIFHYLVPYAQYGRRFRAEGQTFSQQVAISLQLLEHPVQTRNAYYAEINTGGSRGLDAYYNTSQGFWDRMQFVSVDDALINVTDQGKVFGLWPIQAELLNAIPHFLWPDKPSLAFGNLYAHEIGGIPDEDTSTGISFSPTAEAYHWAKWTGVLVAAPLIWLAFFVLFDSLFGDLRNTPWGLLVVATLSHVAPEGALDNLIYFMEYGTEAFVFCAIFASWFAPALASAILGPERSATGPGPGSSSRLNLAQHQ